MARPRYLERRGGEGGEGCPEVRVTTKEELEEVLEGGREKGGEEGGEDEEVKEEEKRRERRRRKRRAGGLRAAKEVEAARATLVLVLGMSEDVFVEFMRFVEGGREGGGEGGREEENMREGKQRDE